MRSKHKERRWPLFMGLQSYRLQDDRDTLDPQINRLETTSQVSLAASGGARPA